MRLSRKWRSWFSIIGALFVPWLSTMTGLSGFWPTFGVCSAAIAWSLFWWWPEISRLHFVPENEPRFKERPFYLILPGIVMLLFALYPFVRLYETAREQIDPLTFEDLLQTYIHDRSLYASDLARTGILVQDKTFDRVTFVGPAVIAFLSNNSLDYIAIDIGGGPVNGAFVKIEPNTWGLGVIIFRDCVFKHCNFKQIQFMGTQQDIDRWKAAITAVNGKPIEPGSLH